MLGKMGLEAVKGLDGSKKVVTKEFTSSVTVKYERKIFAVEGGKLEDYMQLPTEEYALYDPRLMRRVPLDEGGDGEIFELSVPTVRPQPGSLMPRPKLRVRVRPSADAVLIESISASLYGPQDEEAELPRNVTAEQLAEATDMMSGFADLGFNTTLSWQGVKRANSNATTLRCRTALRLRVQLPPPFTRVPRPVVQGAVGLVMRFVAEKILPRFVSLLEADYQRWSNGTRTSKGLGSLTLDDDGFLLVPPEVETRMAASRERSRLIVQDMQADLGDLEEMDITDIEVQSRDSPIEVRGLPTAAVAGRAPDGSADESR